MLLTYLVNGTMAAWHVTSLRSKINFRPSYLAQKGLLTVISDREFTVSLSSKGQLTLPAEIRQLLSLEQGSRLRMRVRDDGTIELKKPTFTTIAELAGIGWKFQQSPGRTPY